MRFLFLLILTFSFTFKSSFGQAYPHGDFISPLNIPLALSGTFGELRSNHFHAGLDLKTQGREGLPVFAAAAGQVVRIKVSAYGYGNALYVAHPNGYTTVYAHLREFSPEIQDFVKSQQYAKQSFEVNLFPPAGKFKVQQGDEIAKSGNSGGSGGPHLHFEIRDSKTSEPLNPAFFGFDIADHKRPFIGHLYAHALEENAKVNGQNSTSEIKLTRINSGEFRAHFAATGEIGFSLHTYDQQDLSYNKNGVYKIEQFVNDTLNYVFQAERISFSKTRYCNAQMDFALYKTKRQLAYNCYVLPGNKLKIYPTLQNRGAIKLAANETKNVKLVVHDSWGNQSTIHVEIEGVAPKINAIAKSKNVAWRMAKTIKMGNVKLHIPAQTLYQDENISIVEKSKCARCETPVFAVGEETIPAHKRMDLSIHKSELSKTEKLVWAEVDERGNGSGLTTHWDGEWLTARPKWFGNFAVMQDTAAPTFSVKNFSNGATVRPGQRITFIAEDDLSGITQYKASIDGKWVLLQYDAKQDRFWHVFEEELPEGDHILTVSFTDEVGNIATYQAVFTRPL